MYLINIIDKIHQLFNESKNSMYVCILIDIPYQYQYINIYIYIDRHIHIY